jgi:hypothetical protein
VKKLMEQQYQGFEKMILDSRINTGTI